MKKPKSKNPKVSKRQQAANKRAGLWTVATDGSYFDQTGQSGGAMVIADADGKKPRVVCWSLNDPAFDITLSGNAELWAAALALSTAAPGQIGTLATDCPFVPARIGDIRGQRLNTRRYNGPLYDLLAKGVSAQRQMHIVKVTRGQSRIPIANGFAQAAAHEDEEALEKQARKFNVTYEWASPKTLL